MKVMHVITRMIVGGAQENTLYNCLDLANDFGDEVKLLTGPSLGAEGELLSKVDTSAIAVEVLPSLRRAIHPIYDARAYSALKASMRSWRPEVVHTHSAKGGLLGRAAAWAVGVPCVIHTVHGAPFHPFQNRMSRYFFIACERWAAKRCHHMISVADAMTDLLVEARVAKPDRFTTIYSGMDVEPFLNAHVHRTRMRTKLGLNEQDIVFGKIARLFHLKGHEYVIEAAKHVVQRVPNAKFLFVGDGLLRQELEDRIAKAELSKHFLFAGLVSPSEIPAYISAMDVLVHTSLREGLARALPQSLIAGKPAISFDIDGAREVVISGQTGCLVPALDTHQLAESMVELAQSPAKRDALGFEGRRRFTDRFRHQSMTRDIRSLYCRWMSTT